MKTELALSFRIARQASPCAGSAHGANSGLGCTSLPPTRAPSASHSSIDGQAASDGRTRRAGPAAATPGAGNARAAALARKVRLSMVDLRRLEQTRPTILALVRPAVSSFVSNAAVSVTKCGACG